MSLITLSKKNLSYNLKEITKLAGSNDKLIAILKDNAYGHGIEEMSQMLLEFGISKCSVRTLSEANIASKYFKHILVLNEIPNELCEYTIGINSIKQLKTVPTFSKIEIKLNTGMNRNGIDIVDFDLVCSVIRDRELKLLGIYTHFHSSDRVSCSTFIQNEKWLEFKSIFKSRFKDIYTHSQNSSSLFRFGNCEDDFSRIGLAMYGYISIDPIYKVKKLKPILSLYADKVVTRYISAGEDVGYGDFILKEDTIVTTYDIGYADGFSKDIKKSITPEGLKIVGSISMDLISIASNADRVLLFNDIREYVDFEYGALVLLNSNIKREIVE